MNSGMVLSWHWSYVAPQAVDIDDRDTAAHSIQGAAVAVNQVCSGWSLVWGGNLGSFSGSEDLTSFTVLSVQLCDVLRSLEEPTIMKRCAQN